MTIIEGDNVDYEACILVSQGRKATGTIRESHSKRKQNEQKYGYVKVVIFLRICAGCTVKWSSSSRLERCNEADCEGFCTTC